MLKHCYQFFSCTHAPSSYIFRLIYCTVLTAQSQDYRIIPIQSRTQAHGVICTKALTRAAASCARGDPAGYCRAGHRSPGRGRDAHMAELMHHHEVNGLVGVLHEPPGKAKAVPAVTAPEARFRAGDLHAGRHKPVTRLQCATRCGSSDLARGRRFALGLCRLGMRGKAFPPDGCGRGRATPHARRQTRRSSPHRASAARGRPPCRRASAPSSVRRRERTSV